MAWFDVVVESHFTGVSQGHPTIRAADSFDPERDCEDIKKAVKGFGCNEEGVINVLCNRNNVQRQQIKQYYKTMFGEDLSKVLIKELHGHLEDLIVALLDKPEEYDAKELRRALKGLGTDEEPLIDILCSRSNQQIQMLKQTYTKLFGRNLEKDICSDTSSDFQKVLMSFLSGGREENVQVNAEKAKADAKALYEAGEKKMGTDESVFNRILALQSYAQLQRVFAEYKVISKKKIEKSIESEFSGHIQKAYLAIVQCAINRQAYFARVLYESMKGMGTDDSRLIWVVVSRSEIDLADVKAEFERLYKTSLEKMISGDTSGKYKAALLKLVHGSNR